MPVARRGMSLILVAGLLGLLLIPRLRHRRVRPFSSRPPSYRHGEPWNDPGLGDHLTGLPPRAATEFSLGVPRVFAIEAGSDRHVARADLSLADGVLRLAS